MGPRTRDPKKLQAKLDRYRAELRTAEQKLKTESARLKSEEQRLRPLRASVKKLRDLIYSRHYQCSLLFSRVREAKAEQRRARDAERAAKLAGPSQPGLVTNEV